VLRQTVGSYNNVLKNEKMNLCRGIGQPSLGDISRVCIEESVSLSHTKTNTAVCRTIQLNIPLTCPIKRNSLLNIVHFQINSSSTPCYHFLPGIPHFEN
jgi:hypothetical protein